jgi:hypothetical protein
VRAPSTPHTTALVVIGAYKTTKNNNMHHVPVGYNKQWQGIIASCPWGIQYTINKVKCDVIGVWDCEE